ncbi:MAG: YceI family protein [Candidatus Limnocylindrales bacterium]
MSGGGSFSDFSSSFVGDRVQEQLATIGATDAVGRAPDITGSLSVAVTATGDLTLHGVTKAVDIALQAKFQGGVMTVVGSLPIMFADYGIEPPPGDRRPVGRGPRGRCSSSSSSPTGDRLSVLSELAAEVVIDATLPVASPPRRERRASMSRQGSCRP